MKNIYYARHWIDKSDLRSVRDCLFSDYLTQGPRVADFEKAIAHYCGAKYAVAVNSGTSALHIAMLAIGLKRGDEGITSAITFAATSNAVFYCGARTVFADIQDATACIDPNDVKKRISQKTKVIIPVHFAGRPCQMDDIFYLAKKRGIFVVEDACHALGAAFRKTKIGSCKYSDLAVLSFHAVKHITTGEGGMVLTNNKDFYQKLLLLRSHGITRERRFLQEDNSLCYYEMQCLGFNYRITDFQCALGLSQFKRLSSFLKRRREIAAAYDQAFIGLEEVKTLKGAGFTSSSHHLYILRLKLGRLALAKNEIIREYRKRGIVVNIHYMPVYFHPYYKSLGYRRGLCPNAERYYQETLTLPLFPQMRSSDVRRVIEATRQIIFKSRK